MKYYKSKIGEYGLRWKPIEGYKRKDGTTVAPYLRKEYYKWKKKHAM